MTKSPIEETATLPPEDDDAELQRLREKRIQDIKDRARAEGKATIEVGASPGAPGLQLWCETHFKPYRADRSLNGLLAGKLLTDLLLNDEPFQTMCGRDDAKGKQADATRIQKEGGRLGPICCYLGASATDKVLSICRESREAAFMRAADAVIARQDIPEHPTRRRAPGGETLGSVVERHRDHGEEDADGS